MKTPANFWDPTPTIEGISVTIGFTPSTGELHQLSLTPGNRIGLVCGSHRTGKPELLSLILYQLLNSYDSSKLRLILCGPGTPEFEHIGLRTNHTVLMYHNTEASKCAALHELANKLEFDEGVRTLALVDDFSTVEDLPLWGSVMKNVRDNASTYLLLIDGAFQSHVCGNASIRERIVLAQSNTEQPTALLGTSAPAFPPDIKGYLWYTHNHPARVVRCCCTPYVPDWRFWNDAALMSRKAENLPSPNSTLLYRLERELGHGYQETGFTFTTKNGVYTLCETYPIHVCHTTEYNIILSQLISFYGQDVVLSVDDTQQTLEILNTNIARPRERQMVVYSVPFGCDIPAAILEYGPANGIYMLQCAGGA